MIDHVGNRGISPYCLGMDASTLTELFVFLVAVCTLVWNQQRSTGKLREDIREDIGELRREVREDIGQLRRAVTSLFNRIIDIGQRLACVEGAMGINMTSTTTRALTSENDPHGVPDYNPQEIPDLQQ